MEKAQKYCTFGTTHNELEAEFILRRCALTVRSTFHRREVIMRHPEIEPRREKPTWKEIMIGLVSFLTLAGLIAWNQVDGNNTQSASNTRINQHTALEQVARDE
jgi:hypothetical protein